jgi:hypothetical protein
VPSQVRRTLWQEFLKQCVDQPLHFLWGFGTGFLPVGLGEVLALAGPLARWLGYTGGVLLALCSVAGWWYRENEQAQDGSHLLWEGAPEWLDPLLDNVVYAIGVLTGIVGAVVLTSRLGL